MFVLLLGGRLSKILSSGFLCGPPAMLGNFFVGAGLTQSSVPCTCKSRARNVSNAAPSPELFLWSSRLRPPSPFSPPTRHCHCHSAAERSRRLLHLSADWRHWFHASQVCARIVAFRDCKSTALCPCERDGLFGSARG